MDRGLHFIRPANEVTSFTINSTFLMMSQKLKDRATFTLFLTFLNSVGTTSSPLQCLTV